MRDSARRRTLLVRVRSGGCLSVLALVLLACAPRQVPQLRVSSMGQQLPLAGHFAGRSSVDDGILTLQLDTVRVTRGAGGDVEHLPLRDVSVRAVVVTDSARHWIPVGVSEAVDVAGAIGPGETRDIGALVMALPLPPDTRMENLWVVFQLRAMAPLPGGGEREVVAHACSTTPLGGPTAASRNHARRLQADYIGTCRL
ncbi:MAG: hypothetical protein ABIZ91_13800 [Gemmatimonadaceae bacterium]